MSTAGQQLSLLDWAPPSPAVRFEDGAVRSQTLSGRVCRAVATTLRDCVSDRETVAGRMSAYLGSQVSVNALNAYASEARLDRMISLPRFVALIAATRDRRLLEMVAEPFGWTVIERRYLPMIELALVRERRRDLGRHERRLARSMQSAGDR